MLQLEKIHVLIVDDSKTTRKIIEKHLSDAYFVLHASNGKEALKLIQSNSSISLVFADLHMPIMNGMLLLKEIRGDKDEQIATLPVIMMTGNQDTDALKNVTQSLGANDFLKKPFTAEDITNRAANFSRLSHESIEIEQRVSHDKLTGLFNYEGFKEMAEKSLAGSRRYEYDVSILSLQIVGINQILAENGRHATTQIIASVATSLHKALRQEDLIAHVDSGRFAVLLPMTKSFKASIVADRFQSTVANLAFQSGNSTIRIKLAAGLNSTEEYSGSVDFNKFYSSSEVAMRASLLNPMLKMMSHNESLVSPKEDTKPAFSDTPKPSLKPVSAHKLRTVIPTTEHARIDGPLGKDSIENQDATDTQADINQHMSNILIGNFDKVPAESLGDIIKKMESFLSYAYQQAEQKKA